MELSLIQKDILITLITLYHQQSHSIKGEEIADMILRNPGTVRNQMQSLKAVGLVDGVPGPKGGYIPTELAYKELNLSESGADYDVEISRDGEVVKGAHVQEIDFTTLCHPDICHAVIKSGRERKDLRDRRYHHDRPDTVNKLLIRGRSSGKTSPSSHCLSPPRR